MSTCGTLDTCWYLLPVPHQPHQSGLDTHHKEICPILSQHPVLNYIVTTVTIVFVFHVMVVLILIIDEVFQRQSDQKWISSLPQSTYIINHHVHLNTLVQTRTCVIDNYRYYIFLILRTCMFGFKLQLSFEVGESKC